LLGPTASGKSALALQLAQDHNAIILSLDSLGVYKEIAIASAKPSIDERGDIPHFGIDVLSLRETCSAALFCSLFTEARAYSILHDKPLILVGGTGFYLKALIDGLSPVPSLSPDSKQKLDALLCSQEHSFTYLATIDPKFASTISAHDRYRTSKGLLVYFASGLTPTEYFLANPPQGIEESIALYEIAISRETLRERVVKRTLEMLESGLIDEVASLESSFGRSPSAMGSIGIKEVLSYFDGKLSFQELPQWIATHTTQLAKRQQIFNKSQFKDLISAPAQSLKSFISRDCF